MDPSGSKKRASATTAAADLTDDLIVEILSRLPVNSICRFKCHRKKLPQTLSGFFYPSYLLDHEDEITAIPDFVGISGAEEDGCGGLLLCGCWKVNPRDEFDYVVCNRAADKWVVLPEAPDDGSSVSTIRLCFDPATFPLTSIVPLRAINFLVITIMIPGHVYNKGEVTFIFWIMARSITDHPIFISRKEVTVFPKHPLTVDTEGKTWSTIPLLESMGFENFCHGPVAFLGQPQGRLISVWILEDYSAGQWIFKYNISTSQLFGEVDLMMERDYSLIAIHPEANVVFFVSNSEDILMSYDMDQGKVRVICCSQSLCITRTFLPYLPYVPFFHGLADQD
ncbi:hypothetical protein SETIT_5G115700v2 [Setaria italica]|uniref:F-box associated domain-containing protein n=1 Tax=Setaria italica TaxID=4555 RepID=A0A368R3Z3_SETIT|nr:hypothetical protein SETIT_5G115700v2 [Setaria italica]